MKRRINWQLGDSSPISAHGTFLVEGSGTLKIPLDFPPSAVQVSFSKIYTIEEANMPEIYVLSRDDDGFTVEYKFVNEALEVNYFAQ